jgi:hypothetical protein
VACWHLGLALATRSVALQISVTIHFYPPFAYVTFLAGLFQEEDLHLRDVYYSELKDFLWETAEIECKTGLHTLTI